MEELRRLAELAGDRGLRICVAESLTSGRLASTVGAGENASEWFGGGVVAYITAVKERVLGLVPGTDPYSPACAEQLATGALALFDADVCVTTTGVGGPGPEGGHPAGTVLLGWATSEAVGHRSFVFSGSPDEVLDATVEAAVRLLAFHVETLRPAGPRRGGTQEGISPIRSGAPGADAAASAASRSAS
ncbi:MAG: CinA family protein [Microbacterium sp.]|nr:CinA family protein [Microbacterium sp.]